MPERRIGIIRGFRAIGILLSVTLGFGLNTAFAQDLDRAGTQWSPYVEWTLDNSSYEGNPFDLLATVTFTHSPSGEQRTTQMFYIGEDQWSFRFTGTRVGEWTFVTSSSDADLDGRQGAVSVRENTNTDIGGFIGSVGNKFARQKNDGTADGIVFNVYMNVLDFPRFGKLALYSDPSIIDAYLDDATQHGFTTIYLSLAHQLLSLEATSYTDHSSVDPDLETFAILDSLIQRAHARGMSIHFWCWGDEQRRQTPIGLEGGINGTVDRRLQRYIAARLGPLPGWTMGYGFDLQEWVTNDQTGAWARYLSERMGWDHMLWARGRDHPDLDAIAYSGFDDFGYQDARERLESDTSRPHIFSERFLHERRSYWDMDGTRRKMWQYAMAGGMGSWWGPNYESGSEPYPNPEQLRTHSQFWSDRFGQSMSPQTWPSTAMVLGSANGARVVLYQERTSRVEADLSSLPSSLPAVAVDTTRAYVPIDIGMVEPGQFIWNAPSSSDWAIALGEFDKSDSGSTNAAAPNPPKNLTSE